MVIKINMMSMVMWLHNNMENFSQELEASMKINQMVILEIKNLQ